MLSAEHALVIPADDRIRADHWEQQKVMAIPQVRLSELHSDSAKEPEDVC
jgi:hypothetical protein